MPHYSLSDIHLLQLVHKSVLELLAWLYHTASLFSQSKARLVLRAELLAGEASPAAGPPQTSKIRTSERSR